MCFVCMYIRDGRRLYIYVFMSHVWTCTCVVNAIPYKNELFIDLNTLATISLYEVKCNTYTSKYVSSLSWKNMANLMAIACCSHSVVAVLIGLHSNPYLSSLDFNWYGGPRQPSKMWHEIFISTSTKCLQVSINVFEIVSTLAKVLFFLFYSIFKRIIEPFQKNFSN